VAKWLIAVALTATGMCVCAGGLLYGVFTVGVPTPDATPAVAAQERLDTERAWVAMLSGVGVSAVGGAGLATLIAMRYAGGQAPAEPGAAADRGFHSDS
jgi:hypothetical protein